MSNSTYVSLMSKLKIGLKSCILIHEHCHLSHVEGAGGRRGMSTGFMHAFAFIQTHDRHMVAVSISN
jgi:hypothetical protein